MASEERVPWGFWLTTAFSLLTGIVLVVSQVAVILSVQIFVSGGSGGAELAAQLAEDADVLSLATLVSGAVLIAAVLTWVGLRGMPAADYLGLRRPSWWKLLLCVALTGAAITGFGILGETLDVPESRFMTQVYMSTDWLPLVILAMVFVAPVSEEVFFRGFVYGGWRRTVLRPAGAAVLSALVFTAIHVQYGWFELVWILLLGLGLALGREWTGSLWTPIAMHFCNNAIAVAMTWSELGG